MFRQFKKQHGEIHTKYYSKENKRMGPRPSNTSSTCQPKSKAGKLIEVFFRQRWSRACTTFDAKPITIDIPVEAIPKVMKYDINAFDFIPATNLKSR